MPDHFNPKPLYTAEDLAAFSPDHDLGFPGEFPYTRGIQPTMYRGRLWTMRQYAGMGDAEESNRRYKFLLDQGTAGLSVAFDLPTQIGYDSDSPMALGEVGKVGVAIDSIEDMRASFQHPARPHLHQHDHQRHGQRSARALRGRGPPHRRQWEQGRAAPSRTTSSRSTSRAAPTSIPSATPCASSPTSSPGPANTFPNWNTISISGYHIREAGSTAAQEIAFTLADGIAYVEAALDAGLEAGGASPRGSRSSSTRTTSSSRRSPSSGPPAACGPASCKNTVRLEDPKRQMLRFHTQTAGSTLTAQQSDNNIVRTTLQAMSAVLGGTQSLHTNSRDEALSLPTEEAP
jgi:methylmalonyl-CoA mutase N-terminal domain/subunit